MVLDFLPTLVTTPTFFPDTTRTTQGTIHGGRIAASMDIPGGGDGTAAWASAGWARPTRTRSQPYPGFADAPAENSSANVAYSQQQQKIDRLNDEVARLRAERAPSVPAIQAPEAQIRAETVLVFRDHHSEEIQNFAIVGETLWVFTEQRARKIPIAALDVPATTKPNDSRGIDFRLTWPPDHAVK